MCKGGSDDDDTRNKYEKDLLIDFAARKRLGLKNEPKYFQILNQDLGNTWNNRCLRWRISN